MSTITSNPQLTKRPTKAEVLARQQALGRKFTEADVDDGLVATATAYLRMYRGDFAFLRKVAADYQTRGDLSNRQVAGVLNCIAREEQAAEPKPVPATTLVAGHYAVPVGTQVRLVRLEAPDWGDHPAGTLVAKGRTLQDGEEFFKGFAFLFPDGTMRVWRSAETWRAPVSALMALRRHPDPDALGYRYAVATGRCWRCGAKLTEDVSLANGLGPICAKRLGVERAKPPAA